MTIPDAAIPLQPALLLTASSVGREITQLRTRRLSLVGKLDPVLAAVAEGDTATASVYLARFDAAIAADAGTGPEMQTVLQARVSILVASETLARHSAYFEMGTGQCGSQR